MPERPFRLRVLDALTETVADISIAGGYKHDLGVSVPWPDGKVFRGRSAYGENDPLPMVSLIEDPRNLDQLAGTGESTTSSGDWNLLIQGFVEDELAHPTDPAYFLLADVKAALIKQKARHNDILGFGHKKPCVTGMILGAGVVRPADDISSKAYFWLPVTLTLVEDNENPFT